VAVNIKRLALLILTFGCGIISGKFLWNKILLPYSNPLNVIGSLSLAQYNPSNDILRFVFFITAPSILLLFIFFFSTIKQKQLYIPNSIKSQNSVHLTFKKNRSIVLFFVIFSILIMFHYFPHSEDSRIYPNSNLLDTFHDGEILGPAVSLEADKIPYKDVVFLHGIIRDPLYGIMAFKLFGKSIASLKVMTVFLYLSGYISLTFFLILFFRGNHWYYFLAFLIPASLMAIQLFFEIDSLKFKIPFTPPRDITVHFFLIVLIYLNYYLNGHQKNIRYVKFIILTFFISFIPLTSFIYSVDRGYYLCPSSKPLY